jgi:hypothetical protein
MQPFAVALLADDSTKALLLLFHFASFSSASQMASS